MEPTAADHEALRRVVRRTKHRRFLELLDPAHPAYNPAYWDVIRRLDGQAAPEPPAPAPAKPRVALGKPHCPSCAESKKRA